MPLATIQLITPTGSYPGQSGEIYTFDYTMSDGTYGEAGHKTVMSPFQIGQQVDYTVTGSFQDKSKLKVRKPGQGQPSGYAGQQTTQQRSQTPAHTQAPQSQGTPMPNPIHGQTVGCCTNQAIAALKEEQGTNLAEYLSTSDGSARFYTLSSDIIRVHMMLEKGKLADPVRVRENPPQLVQQQAPAPVRQAPPPRPAPQYQPHANPTGQAFPNDGPDDGDEIPF